MPDTQKQGVDALIAKHIRYASLPPESDVIVSYSTRDTEWTAIVHAPGRSVVSQVGLTLPEALAKCSRLLQPAGTDR